MKWKEFCNRNHLKYEDRLITIMQKNGKQVTRCSLCEDAKIRLRKDEKEKREKEKTNLTDEYIIRTLKRGLKASEKEIPSKLIETKRLILKLKKRIDSLECKVHGKQERKDFIKAGKYADGTIKLKCKLCMKELHRNHYINNKEKVKEKHKLYREKNPDKVKQSKNDSKRKMYILNRDKEIARRKEYEKKNPNIKKARQKKFKDSQIRNLDDGYVKQQLCRGTMLKHGDIPDSLVRFKKVVMSIKRKTKYLQKENKIIKMEEAINDKDKKY